MQRLIVLILIAVISASPAFAQPTDPGVQTGSKSFYLQKAKRQKTAAWILLGSGTALAASGGLLAATESVLAPTGTSDGSKKTYTAAAVVSTIGVLGMAGSIPLFVSAASNKKKAASLSAGVQPAYYLHKGTAIAYAVPSLKLTINL